jgi:ADP-ribose pyrophosphatase YjhB (NUDIX family)
MSYPQINVRLRLVIIKNGKVLATHNRKKDYYFYIGGHLDYGETVLDGCIREIKEECGADTIFTFQKILYIRDHLLNQKEHGQDEHSVELFILGDVNKFEELEQCLDPQHPDGSVCSTWLDLNNLPDNLLPKGLTPILLSDYKNNFPNTGKYVGNLP